MELLVSVAAHRGRVRQKNEDNLYIDGLILPQNNDGLRTQSVIVNTEQPRLLCVFDGMGGYAAGERASYIASETVCETAKEKLQSVQPQVLLPELCRLANERICTEMRGGATARMGATASMLHFFGEVFTVCNVGDSPIYLFRDGGLYSIHQEHSERANYERITGHAAPPNKKFRLTQSLGVFPEEVMLSPYCRSDAVRAGDNFLICSDGLSDMVGADVITGILASDMSQQQKVDTLLQTALENGGKDNITIVLISVPGAKPKQDLFCCSRKTFLAGAVTAGALFLAAIAAVVVLAANGGRTPAPATGETTESIVSTEVPETTAAPEEPTAPAE